jgi:hypothetical protein
MLVHPSFLAFAMRMLIMQGLPAGMAFLVIPVTH